MSLVVVAVIIALACVWYFTAEDVGEGASKPGWLGVLYEDEADPGTTSFVPRPDWYFYFLLPADLQVAGHGRPRHRRDPDDPADHRARPAVPRPAVGAPSSAPRRDGHADPDGDLDGRPDLQRRDGGGSRAGAILKVPEWMEQYNLPPNAREGAEIFAQSACLNCHVYDEGSSQLGAPELTEEGTRNRGIQWQIDHLEAPSRLSPGSPMPSFAQLGEDNLRKLAIFLEASKGESGGE